PEARRCGCVAWLTSRGSPRRPTWPRRVACIPARARCEASRLPSCPRRRDASPCLTRGGGARPRSMRIVVVMDPPSTVKVDEDTSFALMIEAEQRGHRVDHCLIHDLYLDAGRVWARVRRAHCELDPARPITLGEAEDVDLATVDAVLMRKDPPFDEDYLWATLLLEHARGKTLLVNDPRGLRDANEKIYATYFPELMTETM